MDTATLMEAYGTLGATGVISLLFGFMITNLIKSQKNQDSELEAIREILSKTSEVISNSQSIILKLYEPLAGNIGNRSMVTIEREVLTTQLQDIFYFSDVPDVYYGDGLVPQPQEDWLNSSDLDIGFQNLNQLIVSSSIGDVESDSLISSSIYNYPNLNTNYNEFENHTFFGSAKKKLQNFKTKVETIQGHYTEISKSLYADGVSINGDSVFLIEKRKKLFNKIRE